MILLFLLLGLGMLFAETGRTVTVKNSTGYEFYYLYVSPSNWDNWESDLLEGEYLYDGEERQFTLSAEYGDECIFDIKAVDLDDDSYTVFEVDLCTGSKVEITMDNYDGGNYDEDYSTGSYDEGYQEGYTTGYKDAFSDAYRRGFMDGFEQGQIQD